MSQWTKITDKEDVEFDADDNCINVLHNTTNFGNEYVQIPVEFIPAEAIREILIKFTDRNFTDIVGDGTIFVDKYLGLDPKKVDKVDTSHQCTICHKNWVDSDNGFDTCQECLESM